MECRNNTDSGKYDLDIRCMVLRYAADTADIDLDTEQIDKEQTDMEDSCNAVPDPMHDNRVRLDKNLMEVDYRKFSFSLKTRV